MSGANIIGNWSEEMRRRKEVSLMVQGREDMWVPPLLLDRGQGRRYRAVSCSCWPAEQLKGRKRKEELGALNQQRELDREARAPSAGPAWQEPFFKRHSSPGTCRLLSPVVFSF